MRTRLVLPTCLVLACVAVGGSLADPCSAGDGACATCHHVDFAYADGRDL